MFIVIYWIWSGFSFSAARFSKQKEEEFESGEYEDMPSKEMEDINSHGKVYTNLSVRMIQSSG